jgi:hypothetical protein
VLRAAREAAEISLPEMATRTFYTAAYLSMIETGRRPTPRGVAIAYERILGTTDLGRLVTVAHTPAAVDVSALGDVGTMLAATRRIEDATGVMSVVQTARAMTVMTLEFAREARTVRTEAQALASEVMQYKGWTEHGIGADNASLRSSKKAVELAKESGDSDRLVHALGFAGYVEWSATGNYSQVIALSDAALDVRGAHPVLTAYATMRRAELLAARGETRDAQHALSAADAATETAAGVEPPASMYWWSGPFAHVQRGGVLALLGDTTNAIEAATVGLSEMPPEHRGTEWLASALRRVDPDLTGDA